MITRMVGCLALSALLGSIGCGSSTDADPAATTQPLAIHPVGGQTGALVIALPAGYSAPSHYEMSVHNAANPSLGQGQLLFGATVQLDPSTYCLTYFTVSDCSINIVAGQTTTYTLAGIQLAYDDSMLVTEFGTLGLTVSKVDTKELFGNPWASNHSGNAITTYLAVAGTYQASFAQSWTSGAVSLPAPLSITLAQGQVAAWSLNIPEWRFRVQLVAPERDFPDAVGYGYVGAAPAVLTNSYEIAGVPAGDASFPTPSGDRVLQLPPATSGGFNYTLSVFGTSMTIPAGAADTQVDVAIGRLEVDDVAYLDADGTPATTPGRWSATRAAGAPGPAFAKLLTWGELYSVNSFGGAQYLPQTTFPTKSGIDVISGTYNGAVTYVDAELGFQQQQSFNATF